MTAPSGDPPQAYAGAGAEVRDQGNARVISLAGEFDALAAAELRGRLEARPAPPGTWIVVDFRRLFFIDSAGLGLLVGLGKRMRAQSATLRLVGADGHVMDKLRCTGLAKLWPIHPDLDSALAEIPAPSAPGTTPDGPSGLRAFPPNV